MKKVLVRIEPDGRIVGIFDGDLDLTKVGKVKTTRLSDVEWCTKKQAWTIFSIIDRKTLRRTFKRRSDALRYEHEYMERKLA